MRLRNKKTGGIWNIPKMRHPTIQEDDISFFACDRDRGHLFSYKSLAEINEEWEDYKPVEPLIKDEKIRKAVRAWAEANEISQAQFDRYTSGFSASDDGHNLLSMISFDGFVFKFVDGKCYTIDELCGEEEE